MYSSRYTSDGALLDHDGSHAICEQNHELQLYSVHRDARRPTCKLTWTQPAPTGRSYETGEHIQVDDASVTAACVFLMSLNLTATSVATLVQDLLMPRLPFEVLMAAFECLARALGQGKCCVQEPPVAQTHFCWLAASLTRTVLAGWRLKTSRRLRTWSSTASHVSLIFTHTCLLANISLVDLYHESAECIDGKGWKGLL